jgi:hypothetical protein
MPWFRDQWIQIRGNLKYDILRSLIVVGGAGMIATVGALLSKAFHSVDQQWFVFGGLFLFSALVFILGLRRPRQRSSNTTNKLVEGHEATISIGNFKDISSSNTRTHMRIELIEVSDANKALLEIGTGGILHHGENVTETGRSSKRFWMPRSTSIGVADDAVFHLSVGEGYFTFFSIHLEHINVHTKEVLIQVWFVTTNPYP